MIVSHMRDIRKTLFFIVFLMMITHLAQAEITQIRVGVLAFGTVNWELDTVKYHAWVKRMVLN